MNIAYLRLFRSYCQINKKLSRQGLEAIWTQHIFNTLASPKINNASETLIDYLKDLSHPLILSKWPATTVKQIQDAKRRVMECIDIKKGVKIPLQVCQSQQRFTEARNLNQMITFYPNHFTTNKIFHSLQRASQGSKLMTLGKQGISKSMNYLFAWYLSSITARYQYLHFQEAYKLRQQQLLNQRPIKIIYTSFRFQKITYQTIYNMYLAQCPQLSKQIQDELLKKNIQTLGKKCQIYQQ